MNETGEMRAACIQMSSGPDIGENLRTAGTMIRQAAELGAQAVFTPENTDRILSPANEKRNNGMPENGHPAIPFFSELASELGVWVICGSVKIILPGEALPVNRCHVFSDEGEIAAVYDKIHLYDADLPSGERYRESRAVLRGSKAVVADTPWAGLGLSICYDLRFACLYRKLAHLGAAIMSIPAAFTVPTGKAHWEVLLRARAIETGSFVIAAAQTGEHDGGRKTYGHSMIIGPWGEIVEQAGADPGIILADIDLSEVKNARTAIPALEHDRAI